jgi:hypothetical protein
MTDLPQWAMEKAQSLMQMPWWHKDIARALVEARQQALEEAARVADERYNAHEVYIKIDNPEGADADLALGAMHESMEIAAAIRSALEGK